MSQQKQFVSILDAFKQARIKGESLGAMPSNGDARLELRASELRMR